MTQPKISHNDKGLVNMTVYWARPGRCHSSRSEDLNNALMIVSAAKFARLLEVTGLLRGDRPAGGDLYWAQLYEGGLLKKILGQRQHH
jgi:hypothetical protein